MHDAGSTPPLLDRRRLLGATALGMGTAVAAACSSPTDPADAARGAPSTLPQSPSAARLDAGTAGLTLFSDESMNFQTLFALGGAGVNSEVGEVVTAVDQANAAEGGASYQSFFDAMVATGNRLADGAAEALRAGHPVTARSRYLRAAQYYNQALFFVLGTATPRAEASVYRAMDDSWSRAAALFEPAGQRVAIPYEGSTMPGWFLRPPGAVRRRPTVILNNGSDGQNVDLWAWGAAAALERGWNALIFEGPGQGRMLFVRRQVFRPDWEHVITPVVDHLLDRDDVDPDRIALIGWSEGGELVARAAAFEHRLAALVTDPGVVDVYLAFPEVLREVAASGDREEVNQAWADAIVPGSTPEQRYELRKRLEIYSPAALRQARAGQVPTDWYGLSRRIQEFQVRDEARRIQAPTLVVDYQDEQFYPGQARELMGLLRTTAERVEMTARDGAQYHCAPMAPQHRNEVLFDWLDETVR